MITKEEIGTILATRGHSQYGCEAVTQLEHALQCAYLAEQAKASPASIAAALLHDFGHLVHPLGDDAASQGINDRHEYRVIPYLQPLFPLEVTEPIRMHVAAKRYLCAVESQYFSQLSSASQHSLSLQGGIFSPEEVEKFRQSPHAAAAIQLRRWDEAAKIPNLFTPDLDHFLAIIQQKMQ